MKMKNDLIKTLGIAIIAMIVGTGLVTAAHVGDHGAAYMTPDGLAELKAGSLEIGKYTVWNDHDVAHHKTCIVNVGGVDYEITYKVAGNSGAKIVGVEKVVPETPVVENETEPETPVVENETTPIVDPVDEPVVDPAIDDPIVDPIDLENETEPVVPVVPDNNTHAIVENNTEHASGDDVTTANGANATADVDEVPTAANLMKAPIKMLKAGNPYFLLVIAIFLLIGAVAYNKRH